MAAIVGTEVLICFKFGWDVVTLPFPQHIIIFWVAFVIFLFVWTVWHFWPGSGHNWSTEADKKVLKINAKRD
jgi:hypothetical protein